MSCSTTSGKAMLGCCQTTPPVNVAIGLRLWAHAYTFSPITAGQADAMLAAMRQYVMSIPDLFAWQNPWGSTRSMVPGNISGYQVYAYDSNPPFLFDPLDAGGCVIAAQNAFSAAGFFNPLPPTGVDYGPSVLRVDVRLGTPQGLCMETRTGASMTWQASACGTFAGASVQDACQGLGIAGSYIIPIPDFQPGLAGQVRVNRLHLASSLGSPACCGFPP